MNMKSKINQTDISENPKLQKLTNTASELFFKHGFRRVSVEEICKTTPISKMTFYKFFANKNELVKFILQQLFDQAYKKFDKIDNSAIPYKDKISALIQMKLEIGEKVGKEFLEELYHNTDPELSKFIQQILKKRLQFSVDWFKKSQQQGFIRGDVKMEFILYVMNLLTEMITNQQLAVNYTSTNELLSEILNFFFYGLLTEKASHEN